MTSIHSGPTYALLAALLFGASTPFAKLLVGRMEPLVLAGLFYLGSGIGLGAWLFMRSAIFRKTDIAGFTRTDLPWLAGAILAGGIIGPILLMTGLRMTPASTASLLLNLEGVFTALLAWFVFREQFDRRILIGMILIVLAGILLSSDQQVSGGEGSPVPWGALCITAACLCWALDNNLTRKVAASDAVQIAALKGMAAGLVNLAIAWRLDLPFPATSSIIAAGIVGFCGYGLSLVLFVLALRQLGSARTGAYFSVAPFAGAALSIMMLDDRPGLLFFVAAMLMCIGIWLHLTERHSHRHRHTPMAHAHTHTHDMHHRHAHGFDWDGKEPHSHPHQHEALEHEHPHFPDIHHRHRH
ncbi:MAG: cnrT [Herminiimonas sp.]|nr:cnrT [Herminiimonas sp.]